MIALAVILSVLLSATSIVIFFLVKALFIQMKKNNIYERWILEFKADANFAYQTMKELDDKQIFSKDDEVGVAFKEMVDLLQKLNERSE